MSSKDTEISEILHRRIFHCDYCGDPDRDGPQTIDHYEWEEVAFRTCVVCHKDYCRSCYRDNHKEYNSLIEQVLEDDKTQFVCDGCMVLIVKKNQTIQDAIKNYIDTVRQMGELDKIKWGHYRTLKAELALLAGRK